MLIRRGIGTLLLFHLLTTIVSAQPVERKVAGPTRLDWEFAARGFGASAAKLPEGYDSAKQRYQLFVPKGYRKEMPASLVLFIAPGDGPQGWKNWQKFCEQDGVFFASPFGAGNNTPAGPRTRIVLDVLDDIRKQYSIDPDRTYLTGFSGGGRMACAIGFALPEYFGGIIPLCGTNPINGTTYLRHRAQARLSVAFVTGEKDFNRKENEDFMHPWLQEIGVRSKLWVVPKMDHAVPQAAVISEVHAWLGEDLKRRRAEAKAHPKLAVAAQDTPDRNEQAKRLVESAQDDLKAPTRTWHGVALLQGVTQRWGTSDAGKQAQRLLKDVLTNETLLARIDEQGTADEVKSISAQAKALERYALIKTNAKERLGLLNKAVEAWELLAKNYQGTPIAANAADNIKRLRGK